MYDYPTVGMTIYASSESFCYHVWGGVGGGGGVCSVFDMYCVYGDQFTRRHRQEFVRIVTRWYCMSEVMTMSVRNFSYLYVKSCTFSLTICYAYFNSYFIHMYNND